MKRERLFRMKQFEVRHSQSAMPVGVDGVLVGAWCDVEGASRILDVGTGCGLIALMAAQRSPESEVIGIDIDLPSIEEANLNFGLSPWSEHLSAYHKSLEEFCEEESGGNYDLIVSNPPYFMSGVSNPETARERARHESSLPLASLAQSAHILLKNGGRLSLILPFGEVTRKFIDLSESIGFSVIRETVVKGNVSAEAKRVLLELMKGESERECIKQTLTLEESRNAPTEQYRNLCHDFYLKF